MKISDILRIAVLNIKRSKMRNFITITSIVIGISAFVLVSSIGDIGKHLIKEELTSFGLQGISVSQNKNIMSPPLYATDAEKLKKRFKSIESALPLVLDSAKAEIQELRFDAVMFGVGERANEVYNVRLLHGRVPNEEDIKTAKPVVVIDDLLALKKFKRTNVVGKEFVLKFNRKNLNVKIIGVISSQKGGLGAVFGNGIPEFIYIPYTTLNKLRNNQELSQITIKCKDSYVKDGSEFAQYLAKIKNAPNGYISENISSKISEIEAITTLLAKFISAIAAVSLVVAGLCIMNATFSAVTERGKEIGVCMALGATQKDIAFSFLAESVIISVSGGTVGIILGLLLSILIAIAIDINLVFNFKRIITAELISLICGSLFSIIPALKASKTEPITALRED